MTLPWLLTARLIQATGAAMTMATNFGIITAIFPMNQHGRALGVNSALLQLGNIAGPGIGGGVLAVLSWHWIFLINVPVALFNWRAGFSKAAAVLGGGPHGLAGIWQLFGNHFGLFHHGVLGTNSRTVVGDAVTRDACVRRSCGFCAD